MNLPEARGYTIIGAGLIGLCVARRLAQFGNNLTLVESRKVGGGASGAAAGLLEAPWMPRSRFHQGLAASFRGYPDFIAELARDSQISIRLEADGSLHLAWNAESFERLRREFDRLQSAGAPVRWLGSEDLARELGAAAAPFPGALLRQDPRRVHPAVLLEALVKVIRGNRGLVLESVRDVSVANPDRGLFDVRLEKADGTLCLQGQRLIISAGAWSSGLARKLGFEADFSVVPIRGQMLELQMDKRCTKICHLGDHYLFAVGEDRLWVGATVEDAGFDESVTEAGMEALLATARRLYPDLSRGDLRRSWCGLRPKALRRGGAYLHSRRPDGLVLLAGHYRNGILAGPRDADILAAEILGLPLREFSPFT